MGFTYCSGGRSSGDSQERGDCGGVWTPEIVPAEQASPSFVLCPTVGRLSSLSIVWQRRTVQHGSLFPVLVVGPGLGDQDSVSVVSPSLMG